MTHAELNKAFDKIEKQRKDLFVKLKSYNDKILNQKPAENVWSVIEVVDHLKTAEDFSYQYLLKKTQDNASAQKVGLKETLRSVLLNAYLRSNKKFKAPAVTIPSDSYATLSQADESWSKVRKDISGIWTGLPEDMLDRNWFKHPAAGKLSLMQMITFMQAHVGHHEKQIERTLKAVSTDVIAN